MALIKFKRGDYFSLQNVTALVIETPDGQVTDFTGWSGAAQVRRGSDELVATLAFEWLDVTAGLWRIYLDDSTQDWPVEKLRCDIEFTSPAPDSRAVSTQTFVVDVIRDETRPA